MPSIDADVAGLGIVDISGDIGADDAVPVGIENGQRLIEADAVALMDLALELIEPDIGEI